MTATTIPNIKDFLERTHPDVKFAQFKPVLIDGSLRLLSDPKVEVVKDKPVILITLPSNTAVPFHRHMKKSKVYVWHGGCASVYVADDQGFPVRDTLMVTQGQTILINPGEIHTVFSVEGGSLLVLPSTADSTDIEWEEDAS